MVRQIFFFILLLAFWTFFPPSISSEISKKRIFIVSSYHPEYLWSQTTQEGLSEGMLKAGYIDNREQMEVLVQKNSVESSRALIKKMWMYSKSRNSRLDLAKATHRVMNSLRAFKPDLVFLGDDHATNYIGSQLFNTEIPVVFWGVNGLPLKYGLIKSMERPGYNVTGVWQSGYLLESLKLLKALVPEAENFAVLACDSVTSRPKIKQIRLLEREKRLPLELKGIVLTNSFTTFKRGARLLSKKVDTFLVLNHDTLRDDSGRHVDMMRVGKWYLKNIHKPEASNEGQFVREGLLCAASDSGYNQGLTAFNMAVDILEKGARPAEMPPQTPDRGPLMVNSRRAKTLGINISDKGALIEEVINESISLGE